VATWQDVSRLASRLPEVTQSGPDEDQQAWAVRGKGFAWERPLRRGDLEALGDAAPNGPILCVRVPDLGAKDALARSEPEFFFTTPHFANYPAVLIQLDHIPLDVLEEVLVEAWLTRAPKRLAKEFTANLAPPAT
jgi:hypothetical protein